MTFFPDSNFSDTSHELSPEERLRKLEIEIAERRPVAEMIKYLTYFLAAIGLIIGFFGYTKISDIEGNLLKSLKLDLSDMVDTVFEKRYTDDKASYSDYRDFIDATAKNKLQLEDTFKDYSERIELLDRYKNLLEISGKYPDFQGQFDRIAAEIEHRIQQEPDFTNKSDPFIGTSLDEVWRNKIVVLINDLIKDQQLKNVDGEAIFNFAQSVRQMGRDDLAFALISTIPAGAGSKAVEAMRLAMETRTSTGTDREYKFDALMDMVKNIGEESPAIIIAEAWNVVEAQRRYSEMIIAMSDYLERSKASNVAIPSYAHVIHAELYLRRGYAGDRNFAEKSLKEAYTLFSQESLHNQWLPRSINRYYTLNDIIDKSKSLSTL